MLILFFGLGHSSIYIVDESRNAQAAWEMLQSGDYIVPQFNQGLRGDKPPLHYWLMTAAYAIGGKNAFTARFFSVVMALLLFTGMFAFMRKYAQLDTASWAIIICITAIYLPLQFRLATPDPYLIAFFGLAMLAFYEGWKQQKTLFLVTAYVLLGLASLAKGPIAPAMAGFSILLFLLWDKQFTWASIRRFRPFLGIVVFLGVALPWYFLVHWKTEGVFTHAFFVEHNLDRFRQTKEGHGGNFLLVPLLMIVSLFPFSVLLPQAWRYHRKSQESHYRFVGSVVLAFLVFFTLSQTKLPSYPAPAYPFLVLLIAPALVQIIKGRTHLYTWQVLFLLLLGLGAPVGAYFGLGSIPAAAGMKSQTLWLLAVSLGTIMATTYHYLGRPKAAMITFAVAFGLLQLIVLGHLLPRLDQENHVQRSLALLQAQEQPVIAYHKFSPSYVFNHGAPIHFARTAEDFQAFIQTYGDQCPIVLTVDDRKNDIDCDPRLQLLFKQKDLFERPVTVIYRYENEFCP